jgi:glutamine---fructose-6-phosphate transaminase (isomerizing)
MVDPELGMDDELRESPDTLRRQALTLAAPVSDLGALLRRTPVQVVVTCGRGSSAHAATFAKYLVERHLGIPVSTAAPSIVTLYGQRLQLRGQLFLGVSQSGQSDDIVECALMAKTAGALTVALVNDTQSPLARACEFVLPVSAGREISVAATKTFIGTLGALLRFVASWAQDVALARALTELPDRLAAAQEVDWSPARRVFAHSESLVTIGRGPTLAIAREAALKLKEVCNLHAEAFSGAEFLHGPVSLVSASYPILLFMPTDEAAPGLQLLATNLRLKGAAVLTAEHGEANGNRLAALSPSHADTDAVCLIQSFYALLFRLAKERGFDAERPRHVQKVTRTR